MVNTRTASRKSISCRGKEIPGAGDRQQKITGFDQTVFSRSKILCVGAGGLIGHIAPALVRKGIGGLTILDDDLVEASNLNRQKFYSRDLGCVKAIALVRNLKRECTYNTALSGRAIRFEEALDSDLGCDLAVCGVDNNPTRAIVARHFRKRATPVIFTAVSADADHGYVFTQHKDGPCFGCVFPDAIDSRTYPCPATPAITDILQLVGALAVYAVDSCLMKRPCQWNYREVFLSDGSWDAAKHLEVRPNCRLCSNE